MAEPMSPERNIYVFRDEPTLPDSFHEYTEDIRNGHVPIVIDNGCYKCRVGWANDEKPRMVFKNVIARQRGKGKEVETLIGNDIASIEVVRYQLRSQFDRNIVTQYDAQEQIFDYTFSHLGIESEGSVDHPIVLTEPIANPNYCRQQMSELLFECYHVPSVAYGVDALFSWKHNHPEQSDALIISCGYQTIHVLPVLGGKPQTQYCRRINLGGSQVDSFMQRLLQLKHPGHLASVTLSRAEELVQNHTYMANDYKEDLGKWAQDGYYMDTVHKFQLPYSAANVTVLTAEQQKERREQQVRRMKEMNNRRREDRMAAEQEKLQQLLNAQEMLHYDDEATCSRKLKRLGYKTPWELQSAINVLNNSIVKLRNKLIADEAELCGENAGDDNITDEQPEGKRKRIEKTKGSPEQRHRQMNQAEKQAWITKVRQQRQELLSARNERKQRKTDMTKRRTQASHQRMKIITELAQGSKRKKDDNFGQKDEDWDVYKAINKDAGDSDSEAEQEKLEELENVLREHDPDFKDPNELEVVFDVKEYYRLHVGVERIRAPELLWQPSMIGIEQAGLAQTIDFVLKKFSPEEQDRLVQNVFITGGCANFPHFKERLEKELLCMRPFQSKFSVSTASNPTLDAWQGARQWAQTPEHSSASVTLAEYEENGGEYLKEHAASNRYARTPATFKKSQSEISLSKLVGDSPVVV